MRLIHHLGELQSLLEVKSDPEEDQRILAKLKHVPDYPGGIPDPDELFYRHGVSVHDKATRKAWGPSEPPHGPKERQGERHLPAWMHYARGAGLTELQHSAQELASDDNLVTFIQAFGNPWKGGPCFTSRLSKFTMAILTPYPDVKEDYERDLWGERDNETLSFLSRVAAAADAAHQGNYRIWRPEITAFQSKVPGLLQDFQLEHLATIYNLMADMIASFNHSTFQDAVTASIEQHYNDDDDNEERDAQIEEAHRELEEESERLSRIYDEVSKTLKDANYEEAEEEEDE